jgi:hypothetical protein
VFYHFVVTGLVALMYALGVLAGLFLGRWWQAILYNPGGFKKEYLTLRSQPKLAIATVIVIAASVLFSGLVAEICANIGIILFLLYAFLGTIILHCAFATLKQKKFFCCRFYM